MATRYYFNCDASSTLAPVTVTPVSGWEETADAMPAGLLQTARVALATADFGNISFAQNNEQLYRQFVSGQIGAGQISGTVKGQCLYSVQVLKTLKSRICIRVVSGDGSVVRGTLLALGNNSTNTNMTSTSPLNIKIANGGSLSSVTAENGDRIVVEIGFTSASASPSGTFIANNSGAADLPEDEVETDDTLAPWIEFSQSLAAYTPYNLPAYMNSYRQRAT